MYNAAKDAAEHGSHRFGIVTSGTKVVQGHDLDEICKAIRMIRKDLPILPCASLGIMTEDAMLQLKEAGLNRYHHNLEASPSYFPEICSKPFGQRKRSASPSVPAASSASANLWNSASNCWKRSVHWK